MTKPTDWIFENETDEWLDYGCTLSGDIDVRFSIPKPGNPHAPCLIVYNVRTNDTVADVTLSAGRGD